MTTCPTCSKPLGNDRFCIGPLTAPHPAVYLKRSDVTVPWADANRIRHSRELGEFLRK